MSDKTEKRPNTAVKSVIGNVAYPLLALGIVLSVWAIAAAIKGNGILLPMPDAVFNRFFALFAEEGFWTSIGWTLLRTLISFTLSFLIAFVFAALGALCKPLHRILSPVVSILRAVPTMAVILIIMLWVDFQSAPAYIGFLIAFPLLYSAFYSSLTSVDKELIEMTAVYNVRARDRIRFLYLPQILPSVFDVSRSTISLTLKIVIAAEVLCQTKNSIGLNMQFANLTFEIANLLAWTMLAVILSFILELSVSALKKFWKAAR